MLLHKRTKIVIIVWIIKFARILETNQISINKVFQSN